MKKIYTLLCLFLFSSAFSQSLTSDEIVQKYISAIGGISELKKSISYQSPEKLLLWDM